MKVEVHGGSAMWTDPRWTALVDATGTVFHRPEFLTAWFDDVRRKSIGGDLTSLLVVDGDTPIGGCVLEVSSGSVRFAGGSDVVDYMGPVAAHDHEDAVASAIADHLHSQMSWEQLVLTGLRANDRVSIALANEVLRRSESGTCDPYDASPQLPASSTAYLQRLDSRQRKEVLRKRRRLEEAVGPLAIQRTTREQWRPSLDRLLAWKASAGEDSAAFVTNYGEFLASLLLAMAPSGSARVVELMAGREIVAAAIVLTHRKRRYLYNMSYDIDVVKAAGASSALSPGIILVSLLVEQTVESGLDFDFLKGKQDYKLRLGGECEDLIAVSVPARSAPVAAAST